MRQVTLVALYGPKLDAFCELISECQEILRARLALLGGKFHPYDLRQVHATIVGLERLPPPGLLNWNFMDLRRQERAMELGGLLAFLRAGAGGHLPFQAQIGGFADRVYPFTSRGKRPYVRSFSIQQDKAVLMGWPVRGEPLHPGDRRPSGVDRTLNLISEGRMYPTTLDDIRRAAQNFNVLHAYHKQPTTLDNDLYFRIGLIDASSIESSWQPEIESDIRAKLKDRSPVIVEVSLSDVCLASYEDDTLPLTSTEVRRVRDAAVTAEAVQGLYE